MGDPKLRLGERCVRNAEVGGSIPPSSTKTPQMKISPRIGFVGFGEAGYHLAAGLRKAGIEEISAFDINWQTPGLGEKIQQRAAETSTHLVDSNSALSNLSDIVLSTVTSDQALIAAQQTAPSLTSRHLYADLNSVSPALKQSIERVISATGARYVEVAVMSPIPPYEHRAPMLIGGAGGADFIEAMKPFGMQMEFTSIEVGEAAATKMCRSIIVKGMEALLTECVLGASRYGAEERVFKSLTETFPGLDWSAMATYMVGRVVVHGERRAREMEEVADTLRSMGVEPMMAEATARRMDWSSAQLGLKKLFHGEAPGDPPPSSPKQSWSTTVRQLRMSHNRARAIMLRERLQLALIQLDAQRRNRVIELVHLARADNRSRHAPVVVTPTPARSAHY